MTDAPDGSVPRATVIHIVMLCAGTYTASNDGGSLTIIKDGSPEVVQLPEHVGRRMIGRLVNKYGIKVEYFYHPAMIDGGHSQH